MDKKIKSIAGTFTPDPSTYWDNFKQSNANWLRNFYKQRKISEVAINETIRKQEEHFLKIENIIKNNEKEEGKYFKRFAEFRKDDVFTFKIVLPDVQVRMQSKIQQQKQQLSQNSSHFQSFLGLLQQIPQNLRQKLVDSKYYNFRGIIKLLSNQRYKLTSIAKHSFIKSEIQGKVLIFQVEQGIPFNGKPQQIANYILENEKQSKTQTLQPNMKKNKNQPKPQFKAQENKLEKEKEKTQSISLACWMNAKNPIIVFMIVRDIARGIKELQNMHIFHADIQRRNIICICNDYDCLISRQKKQKLKEIKFKLIDFDNAFVMSSEKQDLFKKTKEIFTINNSIDNKQYKDSLLPCFEQAKGVFQNFVSQYKQFHSKSFCQLLVMLNNENMKYQTNEYEMQMKMVQESFQQIKRCIKGKSYQKLIQLMNRKINDYFNNKS